MTVVLVEDDEIVRRALASTLSRAGYDVKTAATVDGALALVRASAFDLAILDLDLGHGATTAPVADELVQRGTPILILTGLDHPDLSHFPAQAVIAFLAKPATPGTLFTTLELLRKQARAQRELEKVRHLLTESQRLAQVGSYQYNYDTGELIWTDETYRLFGVTRETFVPSRESFLTLIHPDDFEMVSGGMVSPPEPLPRGTYALEYSIIKGGQPGGDVRRLRGVVELREGEPSNIVIGTIQDVTDRNRASEEREQMERRVRVASDANRAKTEFLAHMSHELRTPLNAVLGLSEALIERVFGELNAAQAQTLETIHESGRHLLELINDLLDIARVESGKLSMEMEQAVLRPLIDESTTLMTGTFAAREQRLVIELAPALPPVELDRRRMRQVLINLLGNASKFSADGATITLRVSVDAARREVALAVCDNGPGIARKDLDRIFEPFISIDPVLTRTHDGAGLGLALAKRIVELHRGRLIVESTQGVGSTFTVLLPVSPAYVELPAERTRESHGRAGTVLLVEDNEATVLAVRTYLESRGFGIRVVGDGLNALSAATADDVVLVLMDLQLPGLDGIEVTRRLRAEAVAKPIVALTAYAMPDDERRCIEAGASAYMAKPVRLRQLAETIDRLLERR